MRTRQEAGKEAGAKTPRRVKEAKTDEGCDLWEQWPESGTHFCSVDDVILTSELSVSSFRVGIWRTVLLHGAAREELTGCDRHSLIGGIILSGSGLGFDSQGANRALVVAG